MRRGRAGIGALQKKKLKEKKLRELAQNLETDQIEMMQKQMKGFKANLETFAKEHKTLINKNPVFRAQFQKMCAKVGVDPLASNKGFWAQMLGVGDFYYELAVQTIDICISTRPRNGGLIGMDELVMRLRKQRAKHAQEIVEDDVEQAVKKVAGLGHGFQLLKVGQRSMVLSVPVELNKDHTVLLGLAEGTAFILPSDATKQLKWEMNRLLPVLDLMLAEGMVWVDDQTETGERAYWFPSLFPAARE